MNLLTLTAWCHHVVTLRISVPCMSDLPCYNFWHSGTLALRSPRLSARVPECQKLKMVGQAYMAKCYNSKNWALNG